MPRSRIPMAVTGLGVIALGIVSKLVIPGLVGDLLGSACYTALLVVLAALVARRTPAMWLAVVAFLVSALVEILQLTPVPDAVAAVVPLSRWVLGSTFVWTDFVGYAAGALLAVVGVEVTRIGRRRRAAARCFGRSASVDYPHRVSGRSSIKMPVAGDDAAPRRKEHNRS